ncbi:MAG: hypothetical protein FJ304_17185 [Planctomycetes bacterium]|nr:hypothetical protein [Planctomycetota bacterium]
MAGPNPVAWMNDRNACITIAMTALADSLEHRFLDYPLVRPLARELAADVVAAVGRALNELHDERFFDDPPRLRRYAQILGRRLVTRTLLISRAVQPLLTSLARSHSITDRELYRFVQYAYRDCLSVADIAELMGYPPTAARACVTAAAEVWRERVWAASDYAPCVESFPLPDALR